MADNEYIVEDWYWIVSDHTPAGATDEVYSSAARGYVLVTDAAYLTWLADNSFGPTTIPTENALFTGVLANQYPDGLPLGEQQELLTGDDLFLQRTNNRVINPTLQINQRGYTPGTPLALNEYGPDRWQAAAANTEIDYAIDGLPWRINDGGAIRTFLEDDFGSFHLKDIVVALWSPTVDFDVTLDRATGGFSTTKTITAGGGIQYVTFTSADTGSFTSNISLTIANNSGSQGSARQVSLVLGNQAPPVFTVNLVEELDKCKRYYETGVPVYGNGHSNAASTLRCRGVARFSKRMRAVPTVSVVAPSGNNALGITNTGAPVVFDVTKDSATISFTSLGIGSMSWSTTVTVDAEF